MKVFSVTMLLLVLLLLSKQSSAGTATPNTIERQQIQLDLKNLSSQHHQNIDKILSSIRSTSFLSTDIGSLSSARVLKKSDGAKTTLNYSIVLVDKAGKNGLVSGSIAIGDGSESLSTSYSKVQ